MHLGLCATQARERVMRGWHSVLNAQVHTTTIPSIYCIAHPHPTSSMYTYKVFDVIFYVTVDYPTSDNVIGVPATVITLVFHNADGDDQRGKSQS